MIETNMQTEKQRKGVEHRMRAHKHEEKKGTHKGREAYEEGPRH